VFAAAFPATTTFPGLATSLFPDVPYPGSSSANTQANQQNALGNAATSTSFPGFLNCVDGIVEEASSLDFEFVSEPTLEHSVPARDGLETENQGNVPHELPPLLLARTLVVYMLQEKAVPLPEPEDEILEGGIDSEETGESEQGLSAHGEDSDFTLPTFGEPPTGQTSAQTVADVYNDASRISVPILDEHKHDKQATEQDPAQRDHQISRLPFVSEARPMTAGTGVAGPGKITRDRVGKTKVDIEQESGETSDVLCTLPLAVIEPTVPPVTKLPSHPSSSAPLDVDAARVDTPSTIASRPPLAFAMQIKSSEQERTPEVSSDQNIRVQSDIVGGKTGSSKEDMNSNSGEPNHQPIRQGPMAAKAVANARVHLAQEIAELLPAQDNSSPGSTRQSNRSKSADLPRPEAPISTASPATPVTGPIHQLHFRVDDGRSQHVDVRVDSRHGEIQVSVRTADSQLNESLRQSIHELVSELSSAGIDASPITARQEISSSASPSAKEDTHEGRHSGGNSAGEQKQRDSNRRKQEDSEFMEESRNYQWQ